MERLETKGIGAPAAPATEVVAKAQRRSFTAEYTARILREADACAGTGQIGALLRREGLYSSHLTEWRKLRAHGAREALAAKRRGRKGMRDAREREIAKLSRKNARLRRKAGAGRGGDRRSKKLSEILEIPLSASERDDSEA